jgi:tight adherence protein B
MMSRLAAPCGRGRQRLSLAAVGAICLLGLAGTPTVTTAAADGTVMVGALSPERFDIVGEGHPSGPLGVSLAHVGFPSRSLLLSVPPRGALAPSQVRVVEDGRTVRGLVIVPLRGAATGARYGLHYVSHLPGGGREVEVSVIVRGVGTFDLDYAAPRAGAAIVAHHLRPTRRALINLRPRVTSNPSSKTTPRGRKTPSFWLSGLGLVVVSGIAALLAAAAALLLLVPGRRRTQLRDRIGEFTMSEPGEVLRSTAADDPRRPSALGRLLAGQSWWPAFTEEIDIARFTRSAVELVAIDAGATLLMGAGLAVAISPVLALLAVGAGPVALVSVVRRRVRKQRELFGDQLGQQLEELASAMRAGHSLVPALAAAVDSATQPSRREWGRVVADERLGMPLEDAMRGLARRMASPEVEQVALVAALHRHAGGNMAEILDRVAEGVRERAELRRELRTLTAQARMSRAVVTALPPGLIAMSEVVNPSYIRPLFTTVGGNVMLAIAAVLLTMAWLVMRGMTNVKV